MPALLFVNVEPDTCAVPVTPTAPPPSAAYERLPEKLLLAMVTLPAVMASPPPLPLLLEKVEPVTVTCSCMARRPAPSP